MKSADVPVQDPVSTRPSAAAAAAAVGRRPWDGITGKIAAVIAGMLAVFVVTSALMVIQIVQLGKESPEQLGLDAGHLTTVKALIEYEEMLTDWRSALAASADRTARQAYLKKFKAEESDIPKLLEQAKRELPPGRFREEVRLFEEEYAALRAQYDKVLADSAAPGLAQIAAAEAAVRPAEEKAIIRFEKAVIDIELAREALQVQRARDADRRLEIILGIGAVILVGLVMAATVIVRQIVRPIRLLTATADRVARYELPDTVARIRTMGEGEEPPALTPIVIGSRDETAQLASAIDTLQSSAVSLAVEQRLGERDSAEMLINLGRRNQNLLNRTLAYITDLERTETDPEVLERLFRLDHATTRIRRNAESMLVLAGALQTRTWAVPAHMADVVRAALSEIEDYGRIEIYHMQDAALRGSVISDVVHLLAELLENAAHFSPPSTQVSVVGQLQPEGYRIRIIDEGIGMTRAELDAANETIRRATEGRGASKLLGLYVVGRLAHRRKIEVTLEASGSRGLTATVLLPTELVTEAPTDEGTDAAAATWEHRANVALTSPRVPSAVASAPPLVEIAEAQAPAPAAAATSTAVADPARAITEPVAAAVHEGVVRRVRGAQLPDLGPAASAGPELASMDAGAVRGRLSSLQAGVRAGREVEVTESAADLDQPTPAQSEIAAAAEAVSRASAREGAAADEAPLDGQSSTETPGADPVEGAAVPVRVRGAALPGLGLMDDQPDSHLSPPDANRWKLRSLQLDVDAARRSEQGRQAASPEAAPRDESLSPNGATTSRGSTTTGSTAEES